MPTCVASTTTCALVKILPFVSITNPEPAPSFTGFCINAMLGSNCFTSSARVGVGTGGPAGGAGGGNGALGWPPLGIWLGGAGTCNAAAGVGSGAAACACSGTYCPKIRNTMPKKLRQIPSAMPGAFMGNRWVYRFTPNQVNAPRSGSSARMITISQGVVTGVKSPVCGHLGMSVSR